MDADSNELRQRLERFYSVYAPDKMSDIDNLVKKYGKNQAGLFKALATKYGPEPPAAPDPLEHALSPADNVGAPQTNQTAAAAAPAASVDITVDHRRERTSTDTYVRASLDQLDLSGGGNCLTGQSGRSPSNSQSPLVTQLPRQTAPPPAVPVKGPPRELEPPPPPVMPVKGPPQGSEPPPPPEDDSEPPPPPPPPPPPEDDSEPPPPPEDDSEPPPAAVSSGPPQSAAPIAVGSEPPVGSADELQPPPAAVSSGPPQSAAPIAVGSEPPVGSADELQPPPAAVSRGPPQSAAPIAVGTEPPAGSADELQPPRAVPPALEPPATIVIPPGLLSPPKAEQRIQEEFRMRLVRYYLHYAPDKVPQVDTALRAYRGREDTMFRLLETKYGPESAVISAGSEHAQQRSQQARASALKALNRVSEESQRLAAKARSSSAAAEPFDPVAAVQRTLGSHVDVSFLGPGKESIAASILLLLNRTDAEKIFDPTVATVPALRFSDQGLTQPEAVALECITRFRLVWIDAWFRGIEIRNMELEDRRSIAEQRSAVLQAARYAQLVQDQAMALIVPIEGQCREQIEQEEALRFAGLVSWFRQRRHELLHIARPSLALTISDEMQRQHRRARAADEQRKSVARALLVMSSQVEASAGRIARSSTKYDARSARRDELRSASPRQSIPAGSVSPLPVETTRRREAYIRAQHDGVHLGSSSREGSSSTESSIPSLKGGLRRLAQRVAGEPGLFSQHSVAGRTAAFVPSVSGRRQ